MTEQRDDLDDLITWLVDGGGEANLRAERNDKLDGPVGDPHGRSRVEHPAVDAGGYGDQSASHRIRMTTYTKLRRRIMFTEEVIVDESGFDLSVERMHDDETISEEEIGVLDEDEAGELGFV